ncbi:hypothetical protein [Candidatus Endomicrobiellum pyrsonymphae]|uniref:hypothetical protein n=1 Tax=Candidatus Endomicrobiellum pyrsonymphae TaxID=1408203 RepID=UPI0035A9332C
MKGLVLTILCCFCAMSGFAELSSDTKLSVGKTKEAVIPEKIDAFQRELDVVRAEIELELKKNDFKNNEVTLCEKFLNLSKITNNVDKARVEFQKAKLKVGKTIKECVKLAKINLDIYMAYLKEIEADLKVSKAYLKVDEIETGIGAAITDENRVKLARACVEWAKARLERSVADIKSMNLILKRVRVETDAVKTKSEDVITYMINQEKLDINKLAKNEYIVQAMSDIDKFKSDIGKYEQDLKVAKANVELKKNEVRNGKTIKEYVKLAKLELAIAENNVKWSKVSLKVAESSVKLAEILTRIDGVRAKTSDVATDENHAEEKNSIELNKLKKPLPALSSVKSI